MKIEANEVEINGVVYVPKGSQQREYGDAYIVCGGKTGRAVLFGFTSAPPEPGEPFTLFDARMVLYWPSACGGLLGLVEDGPKPGTRMSARVTEVSDATAHQVFPVALQVANDFVAHDVYRG